VFYHNAPEVLVESRAYILSELLTQLNSRCKTFNNDHFEYMCIHTIRDYLLFMFFSFMIVYIKFLLGLAISFNVA